MRGRKPKPTEVKIAAGNPGGRPLNANEPKPPAGELSPPSWVDGETLQVWNGIVPIMRAMGVATRADVEAIARYCDGIVLWQRARKFLHEAGSTYPIKSKVEKKGTDGAVVVEFVTTSVAQFPQVAEYRQLSKLLLAYESEFGLTASSRTRIEVWDIGRKRAPESVEETALEKKKREFFKSGGASGAVKVG